MNVIASCLYTVNSECLSFIKAQRLFWKSFAAASFSSKNVVLATTFVATSVIIAVLPFINYNERLNAEMIHIYPVIASFEGIKDQDGYDHHISNLYANNILYAKKYSYEFAAALVNVLNYVSFYLLTFKTIQHKLIETSKAYAARIFNSYQEVSLLISNTSLYLAFSIGSFFTICGDFYIMRDRYNRFHEHFEADGNNLGMLESKGALISTVLIASAANLVVDIALQKAALWLDRSYTASKKDMELNIDYLMTNSGRIVAANSIKKEASFLSANLRAIGINFFLYNAASFCTRLIGGLVFDTYIGYWVVRKQVANLVLRNMIQPEVALNVENNVRFWFDGARTLSRSIASCLYCFSLIYSYTEPFQKIEDHNHQANRFKIIIDDKIILELKKVIIDLGTHVVDIAKFSVNRGDYIKLVGRTGIGKSTMFDVLCDVWKLGEGDIRRTSHIVRLPQVTKFLNATSFMEAIIRVTRMEEMTIPAETRDRALIMVDGLIKKFGLNKAEVLSERGRSKAAEEISINKLSGGQLQAMAVISAMLEVWILGCQHQAKSNLKVLMLLDEITAAMDRKSAEITERTIAAFVAGGTFLELEGGETFSMPKNTHISAIQISHSNNEANHFTREFKLKELPARAGATER